MAHTEGPLERALAELDLEALRAELRAIEADIDARYWAFSRQTNARPVPGDLTRRRMWIAEALRRAKLRSQRGKGIGTIWRLADSSFRSENADNILHATDETNVRTLCGRDASRWSQEDPFDDGPDCLTCARVWAQRRGTA